MVVASWNALAVVAALIAADAAGTAGTAWGLQHAPFSTGLVLFGLLGLAARGDSGNALGRLTESVERLAAGEYDVDVASDRDDEIGRLSEAVETLASTLRGRERERRESDRYRRELYWIASDTEASDEETIRQLLELGRDRLDVEAGFVSRIDVASGRYDVEAAAGADLVEVGAETELSEMYCERAVESDGALGIYNAPEAGWADHPAFEQLGISCYVGGKLLVEDDLYGTLCFVGEEPHDEPFTNEEKAFVDLMARWVSHVLERRKRARDRTEHERYRRELYGITSDPSLTDDEKIRHLLELGRERFGVDNGVITDIDAESGRYEVETTEGTDFVEEGSATDLLQTFCRRTIVADDIVGIYNATADGLEADPAYEEWGISCYVGGKLLVEDELYGTLCFVGEEPRDEPFSHEEKAFVDLMARWVSHVLERRERERELRLKDRAMEAAPIGITITDPDPEDNPVIHANEGFERVTGYDAETVVGRNCRFLQGDGTRPEPVDRMRSAVDAAEPTTVELRNYRADGTEFWNRVSIAPVEDDDGAVTNFVGFQEDVTERKERERKLEALVQNTISAIYIKDADGRYEFMNEAGAAFLDRDPNDVVGKRDAELFDDESVAEIREHDAHIMETGESVTEEVVRVSDGERHVFLDNKYPYRDESGEIVGVMGVSRNITERKERERELRDTKQRLELALEGTKTGVWEWVPEEDAVTWSETLERFMGLEPGTFEGTFEAFERRVHPDDRPRVEAAIERAMESEELYRTEFRMRHEDGHWLWLAARGRFVTDESGTQRMVGIHHDITERKERERELRDRERELHRYTEYTDDILDAVDDVFYVLDEDGSLQRWNESLSRATGYADREIEGMHALDFFDDRERERVDEAIGDAFETGDARIESAFLTKAGDEVPYEFVAARLEDPDGDPVVAGIGRDISERVEKERQLSTLISNVPGMVYRCENEPEWPFEFVSQGSREITGYDPRTLVDGDVNWTEDVIAGKRDELWDVVQRSLADREPFRVTYPIETAAGERRWVKEQGRGIFDADGDLECLEGVIIDITERVEYERELERTRHLLEQSQQLARVGAWEIQVEDGEPTGYSVTDEAYRIHGLSPAADVSLDEALEYYRPDDRDRIRDRLERALRDGEGYDVVARLTAADGDERWVRTIADPVRDGGETLAIRGSIQDITERKGREEALGRTTNLLQQAQRMAGVGAWELDVSGDPPYAPEWSDEIYDLFGVPRDAELDGDAVLEFFHPDDREDRRAAVERALETGEGWDAEARIITSTGDEKWVRTLGEPVLEDGTVVRLLGSVQDITEQKEREFALESLHEATQGLLGTETETEIADLIVETAEDVLGVSGVGLYLLDVESNRLEPAAFTSRFVDCYGGTPAAVGRESVLWEAFAESAALAFDDAAQFGAAVDDGLAVPIGDHGVFVVVTSATIDAEDRRLVETLAATTEAALERLESETALRERDAELERRNQRLRRQIQITDIIRRIDQSLIGANGRDEIESTVCDRLVEAEDVTFAWIGAYDAGESKLVPRSWAGDGSGYLDAVALEDRESAVEPSVITAREETPTVVANVVDGVKTEPWRKQALSYDFHSVVSVPLTFDEYFYGVLTVYADEPHAFDDLERTVFAELGENIANSINAVETRQALHADTAVELTLRVDGAETFLATVAEEADASVAFEGLATAAADEARLFFTADGDPATVAEALEDLVSVTDYRLVRESAERALFEVTVTGEVVASRLVRHGGRPRSIRTSSTGLEVVVDVPTSTGVREFVDMLRERYHSVELVGRRDVRRGGSDRQRTESLLDPLTDRQLEVLRTAYYAGFFEWPRESTGEDVAEMLDISQPTVNRHLRLGQRRLFEQLFDAEAVSTR